jgi:uncharacterized peroxidase-related enzyme
MTTAIPENPDLSDVFKAFPHGVSELLAFHDIYLRQDSPLSVADRELIAAYVSGLNACRFCFGAHTMIAKTFGIDEILIMKILDDIDTSPLDQLLKPLFCYLKVLTENPSKCTIEGRQSVLDAGLSERALHDAIVICALFNFMNRLVEGHNVYPDVYKAAAQKERHEQESDSEIDPNDYMNYGRKIGVIGK